MWGGKLLQGTYGQTFLAKLTFELSSRLEESSDQNTSPVGLVKEKVVVISFYLDVTGQEADLCCQDVIILELG